MSTKIYVAWKCRILEIEQTLKEMASRIEPVIEDKYFRQFERMHRVNASPYETNECLQDHLKECAAKKERDFDDLTASVALHLHNGLAYIIPYGEYNFEEIFKGIPGLKDYGYWNNTDQPEDVSTQEWNRRRDVWNKLDKDWLSHLVYYFFSVDHFLMKWWWYLPEYVPDRYKETMRVWVVDHLLAKKAAGEDVNEKLLEELSKKKFR